MTPLTHAASTTRRSLPIAEPNQYQDKPGWTKPDQYRPGHSQLTGRKPSPDAPSIAKIDHLIGLRLPLACNTGGMTNSGIMLPPITVMGGKQEYTGQPTRRPLYSHLYR